MKKCPFCAKENFTEKYFCEKCGSYMGSDHPEGLPPKASDKAKALMRERSSAKTTKGRVRKTPEYVQLFHGGKVKRSTYEWMRKKDEEQARSCLIVVGFVVVISALTQCS